jgi:hypothetical protein
VNLKGNKIVAEGDSLKASLLLGFSSVLILKHTIKSLLISYSALSQKTKPCSLAYLDNQISTLQQ